MSECDSEELNDCVKALTVIAAALHLAQGIKTKALGAAARRGNALANLKAAKVSALFGPSLPVSVLSAKSE